MGRRNDGAGVRARIEVCWCICLGGESAWIFGLENGDWMMGTLP